MSRQLVDALQIVYCKIVEAASIGAKSQKAVRLLERCRALLLRPCSLVSLESVAQGSKDILWHVLC